MKRLLMCKISQLEKCRRLSFTMYKRWYSETTRPVKQGLLKDYKNFLNNYVWPPLMLGVATPGIFWQWASCEIRKIAGCACAGMPGTFSPLPRVSDPDMHHGTCVTHVPWCMPGSLTSGFLWSRPRGKTFPAFPPHAQPAILRIRQEAHGVCRHHWIPQ